jgi:hypothetical protein
MISFLSDRLAVWLIKCQSNAFCTGSIALVKSSTLGSRPINFVDMARGKRTSDYEESEGFSGSKVKLSEDVRGSFNRVLRMIINLSNLVRQSFQP